MITAQSSRNVPHPFQTMPPQAGPLGRARQSLATRSRLLGLPGPLRRGYVAGDVWLDRAGLRGLGDGDDVPVASRTWNDAMMVGYTVGFGSIVSFLPAVTGTLVGRKYGTWQGIVAGSLVGGAVITTLLLGFANR